MDFNPNWQRWIKASVNKYMAGQFDNVPIDQKTLFFAEGFERNTEKAGDWVECRVDGVFFEEKAKGQWHGGVEINLAISVNQDMINAYRQEVLQGHSQSFLVDCICINKVGDLPDDDGTELGCLRLLQGRREKIVTSNFGKIAPNTRILQSTVEAHYSIYLD